MIQRRQFLSAFGLALCAPAIISKIKLLIPRKKVLALADQTVRGGFIPHARDFTSHTIEWWEGDRELNKKLDEMYGVPDIMGMSDEDFERHFGAGIAA